MKNKHEQALQLSEALDRVDDGMLQQAQQTDTAEKFQALSSKPSKLYAPKDRPVTALRKVVAVAACCAIALGIAFGGIALARYLPGVLGPGPTEPPGTTQTDPTTEPSQTTVPTDPSKPVEPNPSGTCGENAVWEFDPAAGTLTISGSGEMAIADTVPWRDYRQSITQLVVEPGITSVVGFNMLTNLTRVTLPDTLRAIQQYAFAGCTALAEITLPSHLEEIGTFAFNRCPLQTIQLPEALTYLGSGVFMSCELLTEIVIPDNVTNINGQTFYGCTALRSVTLGKNIDGIAMYAFENCIALTEITVPAKVRNIGERAFSGCTALAQITFLGAPPKFDATAFTGVTAAALYPNDGTWTETHMQNYSGTISWQPYDTSENIISGNYSDTITWQLNPVSGLLILSGSGEMVHLPNGMPWRDYTDTIRTVIIESGIESIGDYAFYMCGNLKNVTLPDSVTAIGKSAFSECKQLESIALPRHLASIGEYAFFWCSSLTEVSIPGSVTSLGNSIFSMCDSLTHVTFRDFPVGPT